MEEPAEANSIPDIPTYTGILGGLWKDILQRPHDCLYRDKQQEIGTALEIKREKDDDLVAEQIIILFV